MTEDILPHLSRSKVFIICDIKNRFWNIGLDKPSINLTTFVIPFGRYCWVQRPMDTSPEAEVFQCKLNQRLPGIKIVVNEILNVVEGN